MADGFRTDDRGVSEVIGYVLVFGLVLTSIGLVSSLGIGVLEDVRSAEQSRNAETAFDVLHANMAQLHAEHAPSRATEMDIGDTQLRTGDNVTVRIHLDDGSSWDNDTSYDVRPVVQRLDKERKIVYEAGAVLRTNRESGIVVSDPPILSSDDNVHITIPATQSDGTTSVGGGTVLVRGVVTEREVLVSDTDGTYQTVVLNVTSPRANLWHDHLEEKGFDCSDPSGDVTECKRDTFSRLYVTVHEIDLSLVR